MKNILKIVSLVFISSWFVACGSSSSSTSSGESCKAVSTIISHEANTQISITADTNSECNQVVMTEGNATIVYTDDTNQTMEVNATYLIAK
jgi:hypothetical protein